MTYCSSTTIARASDCVTIPQLRQLFNSHKWIVFNKHGFDTMVEAANRISKNTLYDLDIVQDLIFDFEICHEAAQLEAEKIAKERDGKCLYCGSVLKINKHRKSKFCKRECYYGYKRAGKAKEKIQ